MMHEMGAHELARQYEWWTMKSQPNALKRLEAEDDPERGLVAVDFRAGMALLPFLPQCPADFKLIVKGVGPGQPRPVRQGRRRRARSLCRRRMPTRFAGMAGALEALKSADEAYRDSLPDITHHHIKLITKPRLWTAIHKAWVRGWEIRRMADPAAAGRLGKNRFAAVLFLLLGLLPLLTPDPVLARIPGAVGRALAPLARPASRAVRPQALGPGRDPPPCRGSRDEGRLPRPGLQGACRRGPRRLAQVGAGERRARPGHRLKAGALSPQPAARVPSRRASTAS